MTARISKRRRWLAPEVIQTSAMDCGPAVLTCLLSGYGIPAHYGRIREACQTDVDGTSIDVLEEVLGKLGLSAEQEMLPPEHLLLPESDCLPAILVVVLPDGLTHFVLVWRRLGPLVQVMDPAQGRRWMTARRLLEEAYVHTHHLRATDWHEWALSDSFRRPFVRRLKALGLGRRAKRLVDEAAAAADWRGLAALEAAARLVEALVRAGGVRRGGAARRVLAALWKKVTPSATANAPVPAAPADALTLAEGFWSALPSDKAVETADEELRFRGAVLVRVLGRVVEARDPAAAPAGPALGTELAAALAAPASRPGRTLWRLLGGAGLACLLSVVLGLLFSAGAMVLEALLLRGAIDLRGDLALPAQRLAAAAMLLTFVAGLLLIEFRATDGLLMLGRRLETRLRAALLDKLPRLHDRYLQSRPVSDMAQRSHALHQVRMLPRLAGQFARAVLGFGMTVAAIAWVDPASAPVAAAAAAAAIAIPLASIPFLAGLDLRVRTHAGALCRCYLDALLGLSAARAHRAEQALRSEHESLLVEWRRAGERLLRWVVVIEGVQALVGFGLAAWLLFEHANRASGAGAALLVAYWVLNLPELGEEVAQLARQYPLYRNITLRLLEPLGAPEATAQRSPTAADAPGRPRLSPLAPAAGPLPVVRAPGAAISFESVSVQAAGHTILEGVTSRIEAGSHVAIVGPSGAGKSSLVGLLFGWHRPSEGLVRVDGRRLDDDEIERLRPQTVWVDPAVQLWNRSALDNLRYGLESPPAGLAGVLDQADLHGVIQRLPRGLQSPLGEGGGLVSGGEGQRLRLGRGLLRRDARLIVLDEPFRGLDRQQRRELLTRVRKHWAAATILCITHDVGETRDFHRVLVIESGRLVEDAVPERLAADPASRYRAMLEAEESVRTKLWRGTAWRRLELVGGKLIEHPAETQGDRNHDVAGQPPA